MISEKTIEQVVAEFDAKRVDYEKSIRQMSGRQPAVMSFLLSDTEGALTEDEQEMLIYLAVIIWRSIEMEDQGDLKVTATEIAEAEEANWNLLGQSKARSFRERLDVFFENTDQEDLLAFIEDSLTPGDDEDDDLRITPEGREPMFVALKTVVDVLVS